MTIHKEGRTLLFVSLIILVGIIWLADYFFHNIEIIRAIIIAIGLIFYLLFLQFFRSPSFEIKRNEKQVLAPADGKVVVIEETEETEYLSSPLSLFPPVQNPFRVFLCFLWLLKIRNRFTIGSIPR